MKRITTLSYVLPALILGLSVLFQPVHPIGVNAAIEPMAPVSTVPLYRLHVQSPRSHFYTSDENRKLEAVGAGWSSQGVAAHILNQQAPGTVPLYVLEVGLNFGRGHNDAVFGYTTSQPEKNKLLHSPLTLPQLCGGGEPWKLDGTGIAGYIASTQLAGTVPLYRLYHPPEFGPASNDLGWRSCLPGSYDNFYTINEQEKADFITKRGYKFVHIEGYVWPEATTVGNKQLGPGKPVSADTVLLKAGCTRPSEGAYNCPTVTTYEACQNYRNKGEVKACSTTADLKQQAAMEAKLFTFGCKRFINNPENFVCKTQAGVDACEVYHQKGQTRKCLLTTK